MHNCVTPPLKTYRDNKKEKRASRPEKAPCSPETVADWGWTTWGSRAELQWKHHARAESHTRKKINSVTHHLHSIEVWASETLEIMKMISPLFSVYSILFHALMTVKHTGTASTSNHKSDSISISYKCKYRSPKVHTILRRENKRGDIDYR